MKGCALDDADRLAQAARERREGDDYQREGALLIECSGPVFVAVGLRARADLSPSNLRTQSV